MIELYISQNKNTASEAYGKYYPRVSYKQTMNIHDMAVHMAEHNTPFSEGTIEGILRDFVKCVREQTLNGNTVKVDNLAILSSHRDRYLGIPRCLSLRLILSNIRQYGEGDLYL